MAETYDKMTRAMKVEWPSLKVKLHDEKVCDRMREYYEAYLAYEEVMDEDTVEHRRLVRAYAKLVNRIYGPILPETD